MHRHGCSYSHAPLSLEPRLRVQEIAPGVYMIRVEDEATRFFEALWEIPEGITYNAYVVTGPERVVLLDTVRRGFEEEFLSALSSIVDPRDIDAVVVHHAEPDHSGALPAVLERARRATVYAHPMARGMLEALYGIRIESFKPVKDGMELGLGGGHRLVFLETAWLHWPETVMSLLEPGRVLFTGDAFGAYTVPGVLVDSGDPEAFKYYTYFMRKYFATIIGAYRRWVTKALDRLETVKPKVLAPLHGMAIERHVQEAIGLYRGWASGRLDTGRAVVVYSSMYGAVEEAVQRIAGMLEARGLDVSVYGFTGADRANIADLLGEVLDAGYLVVGAATYEASVFPLIWHVLDMICSKASAGQRVLVVSSYAWGGAAARRIAEKLQGCGLDVAAVVESKGRIPGSALEEAVEKLLSTGAGL
ncbi:FprA family A-type flavoprotein [Pyrodictium abyssi]|uniref:FprA family A-type flavoprotein n=1 Tax=Pyrodictium abyssi TaxID=54256 RepID=A0ABM8IYB6_9CREN|nr:FprA family A-type flavoprotein [Pyrodictium abyssi]